MPVIAKDTIRRTAGNNIALASVDTLADNVTALSQVAAAAGTVTFDRSTKIVRVALAVADTGGGVFGWVNPEVGAILVTRVVLDVTTKATSAATLDVGYTVTGITTSSDTLLDGVDVGTAAGVFDNIENQGTNGVSAVKVPAGKWLTASKASGACAGLVGFAYIHYNLI